MPFEQRVEHLKQQGFGCAHLAMYHAFDDFTGAASLTPGFAFYIRGVFERNQVDMAVLGCYLNLLHPDSEALEAIHASYRSHLMFAARANSGVVGTETGCPNAEYKHVPECRTDACFEKFIKNIAPVVEYAEKCGVILGVEPVRAHAVYDAKRARKMLDILKSPNVKIIFDPVNLLDLDNVAHHRDVCKEFIDLLGDEIVVLHLKDFKLDGHALKSVALGQGQSDLSPVFAYAKRYKPHIHATLEDTVPDNAEQAMRHAAKLYAMA